MPDLQSDVAAITATVTALEISLEERTQHCAAIQARQGALQRSSVDLAQRRAPVSYTHLRAHETVLDLVCRLLLAKKKRKTTNKNSY